MRNRIEIAKKLLRDDGLMVIQIDDIEQAYLKLLCDEVFGRDNFVNCITVKMSERSGRKMAHVETRLPKLKEYLLVYKKKHIVLNPVEIPKESWDDEYNRFLVNFSRDDKDLIDEIATKERISEQDLASIDRLLSKVKMVGASSKMEELNIPESERQQWKYDNAYRIVRTAASSSIRALVDEKREQTDNLLVSVVSERDRVLYICKTDYSEDSSGPRVQLLFADDHLTENVCDLWTDIKTTGLEPEGGVELKRGKKPEELIQRIIELTTDPGDVVLDFFLGSGTAAAVAHKMNRRYIGIEQLDYGENDPGVRLQNVIDGDQTGISKEVGWEGGGSFVYCELAEWNQRYVDKIKKAKSKKQLKKIWNTMKEEAFLSYKINPKDVDENIEEFKDLSLKNQKKLLTECLDKNHLYVNLSEIDDEEYGVSEENKRLNKQFYRGLNA